MTITSSTSHILAFQSLDSLYTKEWIEPSSENALISERAFLSLEKFISEGKKGEENILTMSFHKKYGKIIKAQNYVGVIQTDDGTTIEILPKIHREQDEKNVRSIFLKMLKALKDSPFKNINEAHLRTHKFPILEIFIKSFLDELTLLIKKGIKKNYILIEGNERFLKWRLKVMDNIRRNSLHKERFAVEYDDFTEDIAENRLIKSTLLKLNAISKNNENKKRIKEFLLVFNEISKSGNIEQDIDQSSHISRLHSYYTSTLSWVRIFLREESVVSMAGKSVAFSLLFSMEKIFENYVAKKIKEKRPEWIVKTQDKKYSLIEDHKDKTKVSTQTRYYTLKMRI
jgi:5-methylcytosine-specific restriction enzyme subunit McrC